MSSDDERYARDQKLQRDYDERYARRMSKADYKGRKDRVESAKRARREAKRARRMTG